MKSAQKEKREVEQKCAHPPSTRDSNQRPGLGLRGGVDEVVCRTHHLEHKFGNMKYRTEAPGVESVPPGRTWSLPQEHLTVALVVIRIGGSVWNTIVFVAERSRVSLCCALSNENV